MSEQCACREGSVCFREKPTRAEARNYHALCFPCQTGNHYHGYGGGEHAAQHAALVSIGTAILQVVHEEMGGRPLSAFPNPNDRGRITVSVPIHLVRLLEEQLPDVGTLDRVEATDG